MPRQLIGMAVNSRNARNQDQLHIHIECLQPLIRSSLQQRAERLLDSACALAKP